MSFREEESRSIKTVVYQLFQRGVIGYKTFNTLQALLTEIKNITGLTLSIADILEKSVAINADSRSFEYGNYRFVFGVIQVNFSWALVKSTLHEETF